MINVSRIHHQRYRQQGVALVMAMAFLLILTLIGVTAMTSTSLQERMAGNAQDKHVAFQAAESALRAAESYLNLTPEAALPAFDGATAGHFQPEPGSNPPLWETIDWTNNALCGAAGGVVCVSPVSGVKEQPRYMLEELGTVDGNSTGTGSLVSGFDPPPPGETRTMYRVTAHATGGTSAAVSVVQSVFRK